MSSHIPLSKLHYEIIEYIIANGFAPDVENLCEILKTDAESIARGLDDLQDYHGVVLHPGSPAVWAIHPFSLSPTNFLVKSAKGQWWGSCAWCSLGIAAIVEEDVEIVTSSGAHGETVTVKIIDGLPDNDNLLVHFPIPMTRAWDNVIYTCSTMLVFKTEKEIKDWCIAHNISVGDIQPIGKAWDLAKKWYGNHRNPNWQKWSVAEARAIFNSLDLTHPVWQLPESEGRF